MLKLIKVLLLGVSLCWGINSYAATYNLNLDSEVTDDSMTPLVQAFNTMQSGDNAILFINSPGGSVDAGQRLEDAIDAAEGRGVHVEAHLHYWVASMAAEITMHAQTITADPHTLILFHTGSVCGSEGPECLNTLANGGFLYVETVDNAYKYYMWLFSNTEKQQYLAGQSVVMTGTDFLYRLSHLPRH